LRFQIFSKKEQKKWKGFGEEDLFGRPEEKPLGGWEEGKFSKKNIPWNLRNLILKEGFSKKEGGLERKGLAQLGGFSLKNFLLERPKLGFGLGRKALLRGLDYRKVGRF